MCADFKSKGKWLHPTLLSCFLFVRLANLLFFLILGKMEKKEKMLGKKCKGGGSTLAYLKKQLGSKRGWNVVGEGLGVGGWK